MTDHIVVSRRDVGAGVAVGGAAFLAALLLLLWNLVQGLRLRGSPVLLLAMTVTPVIALLVATVVWRVTLPDEPNPGYGALAGALAAAVSTVLFAALIGVAAAVTEWSAGTLGGSVSEFLSFAGFFVVYGGLVTLPIVVPVGASVGYGYERYLASGET